MTQAFRLKKISAKQRQAFAEQRIKDVPNKLPRFEMIDKNKLSVDPRYQREYINQKRVEKIAKNFHWALFQTLCVAKRDDGMLVIWDGQHRWQAANKREDVAKLPCLVWDFSDIKDEAIVYKQAQDERTPIKSFDKYKSDLIIGEPAAMQIKTMLSRHGFHVGQGGRNTVACVDRLRTMAQRDPVALDITLGLIRNNCPPDGALREPLISGLFYLAQANPDRIKSPTIAAKLRKLTEGGLMAAIHKRRAIVGHGAPNVYAQGVKEAINKGLHKPHKLTAEIEEV